MHSMATSIGTSATAGISDRMTPCPAVRIYPGLQTPVFSATYTRPSPALRQVLPQQGNPIPHLEIKIEKLRGVCGLTFSLLLSPPSLKTRPSPVDSPTYALFTGDVGSLGS